MFEERLSNFGDQPYFAEAVRFEGTYPKEGNKTVESYLFLSLRDNGTSIVRSCSGAEDSTASTSKSLLRVGEPFVTAWSETSTRRSSLTCRGKSVRAPNGSFREVTLKSVTPTAPN